MEVFLKEGEWDEANRNLSAQGMLYGVPVGVSYGDYHTRAKQMMRSANISFTHEEALNVLWMGLDSI